MPWGGNGAFKIRAERRVERHLGETTAGGARLFEGKIVIELRERQIFTMFVWCVCLLVVALSFGRGMFVFSSFFSFSTPTCLKGKGAPFPRKIHRQIAQGHRSNFDAKKKGWVWVS